MILKYLKQFATGSRISEGNIDEHQQDKWMKVDTSKARRRLVIPDIHGCSKTLSALLQQVQLSKQDYLFFLGDFIDKGIDSKGVLDIVIGLIDDGFQVFPLRGNHEHDLIELVSSDEKGRIRSVYERMGGTVKDLFVTETRLHKRYEQLLSSLPYCYELEDFYLVHAGFDFKASNPFQAYEEMLWLRRIEPDRTLLNGKRIIHGHTPLSVDIIKKSLSDDVMIGLDAGAVFHELSDDGLGLLLCLDMDSLMLYQQTNLEG